MTLPRRWRAVIVSLAAGAAACSPALNWREVRLERLVAMLPCKPDQAQRDVQLGALQLRVRMSGCEAAGALYAISHARLADPDQAAVVLTDWRKATLANMQASDVQTQAIQLAKPGAATPPGQPDATGTSNEQGLHMLLTQGKQADGTAVQARLLWLTSGADVYHVAVYGARLGDEMLETLFSELRLQ